MSAGIGSPGPHVNRDLMRLAPRFREAVKAAVMEARDAGYDVIVFEAYRSPELQELYYQRGRTVKPPERPVTNARSNLYSWHGYGLAIDAISESDHWNKPESWFRDVAEFFKKHGCRWGGDWKMKDLPHFQWGRCKPSPSDLARQLFQQGGVEAVWDAVGATTEAA